MRCKDFHRLLAEWVRGRLPDAVDQRMTLHATECRSCAEEAELERSLRESFRMVAPIAQTPDLWERIEARIETVKRPRFAFRLQQAFALCGALAAGALLVFVALPRGSVTPPDRPAGITARVSEPGVLEKINYIRGREADPVGTWSETPYSSDAARILLVGNAGR